MYPAVTKDVLSSLELTGLGKRAKLLDRSLAGKRREQRLSTTATISGAWLCRDAVRFENGLRLSKTSTLEPEKREAVALRFDLRSV
jgi:hypothetical protein